MSTVELDAAAWRKSSHSAVSNGDCLEVADGFAGVVPVRDSKRPGPVVVVPADAWRAFVEMLNA